MIATHLALVVLCAIVLYPVMLVCKKAFEPGRAFALSASPIPHTFTLDNFERFFAAPTFWLQTFNSILIAVATTVVGVVLSCTAAYSLSRFRFPGRNASLRTFLVVQMFPA